jgi:hypothetical protein
MSEDEGDELEFSIIIGCTRAQALDEGLLVDVSSTAKELGIKAPTALTRAVWDRYVLLSPAAEKACNDERGRLWDILWMFRNAAVRKPDSSEVIFELSVVTESIEPSLVKLKAVCGPGDDAELVFTIMLPEED